MVGKGIEKWSFPKLWELKRRRWEKDGMKRQLEEKQWVQSSADPNMFLCLILDIGIVFGVTVIRRLKWAGYPRQLTFMNSNRQGDAGCLLGVQLKLLMSAYIFFMWLVFYNGMTRIPMGASWVLSDPRANISKGLDGSHKTYNLALEIPQHHFQCILWAKQITEVISDLDRGNRLHFSQEV